MPTIREIADECGVTKQTVTARLRALGLWDAHVQKDGRAFIVDPTAASAVAASIARKGIEANDGTRRDSPAFDGMGAVQVAKETNEALKMALSASQESVATLARQLDAKDAQIRDLSERLAAAQEAQERAQSALNRMTSRSWLDRLLGRGLPAPKGASE